MYRRIFRLALPNIVSNITVPLLTLVDLALAGHMGSASTIGAISVAAGIINFVVWFFAFLRMGSTGFTAQAYGRSDVRDICLQLARGLSMALIGGVLVLIMRPWLYSLSGLISAGRTVIDAGARSYLSVAFWGVPAALALFVLNGWFIGMQNARVVMVVAVIQNLLNIFLSSLLVLHFHWDVSGLALGTVVAQYAAVLMLLVIGQIRYGRVLRFIHRKDFISFQDIGRYLRMSADMVIRTALLSAVTLFFTYAATEIGTLAVAVNALLMQLFTIFSFLSDGFAYAGEALTGRYVGECKEHQVHVVVNRLFVIGWVLSICTTIVYLFFPEGLLYLLTDNTTVRSAALHYSLWAALIPVCGFAAFLWDGFFVGATNSAALRLTMMSGVTVFFGISLGFGSCFVSAGERLTLLWIAFLAYLAVRSLVSWYLGHRTLKRLAALHS